MAAANVPNARMSKVLSIRVNEEGKEKLDFNTLFIEDIVTEEICQDCPLLVVAVNGKKRTGKSFLVNLMIDYLSHLERTGGESSTWLKSNEVISGVDWKDSVASVTSGIWMSNRPYVIKCADGTQINVLLMDCQGLFNEENQNPILIDKLITLCSLKLSTVHILNVDKKLNDSDTQNLAAHVTEATNGVNADVRLRNLFLVHRDWPGRDDSELGFYPQAFDLYEKSRNLTGNERVVKSSFQTSMGFVLPEPGKAIRTGGTAADNLRLKELLNDKGTQDFLNHVEKFFKHIFLTLPSEIGFTSERSQFLEAIQELAVKFSNEETYQAVRTLAEQVAYKSMGKTVGEMVSESMANIQYETEVETKFAIDESGEQTKQWILEEKDKDKWATLGEESWEKLESKRRERNDYFKTKKMSELESAYKKKIGKGFSGGAVAGAAAGGALGAIGGGIGAAIGAPVGAAVWSMIGGASAAIDQKRKESAGREKVEKLRRQRRNQSNKN